MLSFIVFILILSFLILIHELGHFTMAKINGILVEEFGFGLPPRIAGIQFGETLYSINALPFGGFVKLFGEEVRETEGKNLTESQLSRAFSHKKPWQKTSVIVAGVFMNLIVGIIIYYVLLSTSGFISDPLIMVKKHDFKFGKEEQYSAIFSIVKNSPADKAHIKPGDQILFVHPSTSSFKKQITSAEEFKKEIQNWYLNIDQSIPFIIDTKNIYTGKKTSYSLFPTYDNDLKRAVIGVGLQDIVYLNYNKTFVHRLFSGIFHSYNIMAYNYSTVFDLIKTAIGKKTIQPVAESVAGPVGIFSVIKDIVTSSGNKIVSNILNVTAILSLSLAVMNILPIPALDGGRLLFIIYESIRGKRINPTIEQRINMIGFAFLLFLIGLITLSDIAKLFR